MAQHNGSPPTSFLDVRDLVVHYDMLEAVRGVSLEVPEGQIVALLGANGCGKSTILKAICGLKKPTRGEIWFQGERIDGLTTPKTVRKGVAMIPEGRGMFPNMTVEENLLMGAYTKSNKVEIRRDLGGAYERFPALWERKSNQAGTLSGGEQEMVAIARALMSRPRLLLMDEPVQGLAPVVIPTIADIVKGLNKEGVGIILVEHNVHLALGLSDKVYIMGVGDIIREGSPTDLSEDDYVKEIYLGG